MSRADLAVGGAKSPPRNPAPALELRALAVELSGREIFRGLELTAERGEFLAVLGPNGAGKSTLMKAILGLLPLAGGSATVLGSTPAQARSRVGYLPQRGSVERSTALRGIDIVALGLHGARWGVPLGISSTARARREAERARVQEVIELVGASGYARRRLGALSGGEQQRLLIAQALVRKPELLILDEPLDSLDLPNQAIVAGLVRRICSAEGVTVLLVAHDVNPLLGHLDRVVYMVDGQALVGSVEEVITAPKLSALYGSPIEVLRAADGRRVVVGQPEAPHHHGHRHEHT